MQVGFVAIVGLPNAGKSTLLNRLVGEHLAITHDSPQTTRRRVVGVRTDETSQIVFVDTPGLVEPDSELHTRMRAWLARGARDADLVVHLADATRPSLEAVRTFLAAPADGGRGAIATPVLVAFNKGDSLSSGAREALGEAHPDAVILSAATGDGVADLLTRIAARLPDGAPLYPLDELSTQPLRFFASEFVREACLEQLRDELPYALTCVIEEFRETASPVYIRATIHVERDSQKGIVVGAGGSRIREIGRAARARLEALVGSQVYLDLRVRVAGRWRRDPRALDRFGLGNAE